MPYDPIEQEIIDTLLRFSSVAIRNGYRNPDWTKGVKAIFGGIGYQRGYRTYFSDGAGREFNQIRQDIISNRVLNGTHIPDVLIGWLYDILWWEENQYGATDIPLVCESDWGNIESVKYDFQKLLLARSKYRIMIFECGRVAIQWCKSQIKQFKLTQSGDRYLFCSWEGNNAGFYFELYVHP